MQFIAQFLSGFFSNYKVVSATEDDISFSCTLTTDQFTRPNVDDIQTTSNVVSEGDVLIFSVKFGEAEPITFSPSTTDVQTFIESLIVEYEYQQGEVINSEVVINKVKKEQSISIYDLSLFTSTLEGRTIQQQLSIFDRALGNSQFVNFVVFGLDKAFNTSSLFFIPRGKSADGKPQLDRFSNTDKIKSVSHFAGVKNFLAPEVFRVVTFHPQHGRLLVLLSHLSTVLSVVYLFDITSIADDNFQFKINGYKSISGELNLKPYPIRNSDDYYSIYQWVYTGGNLNDKIGLARNIISLHFDKAGELSLNGSPFQSVQSSYRVYEKQNIKQYIEIRNKISDQLLDFNNRANKLIETFATGFQKNALALITLYITAIVLRIVSKGEFVNVFTFDITMISLGFIACSFIYFGVSRWEVLEQKRRFIQSYENLKARYTDLLTSEDIQRIVNNDKEYNDDKTFIDDKLKMYSQIWIWFLVILLCVTLILFVSYKLSLLVNTLPLTIFFSSCEC